MTLFTQENRLLYKKKSSVKEKEIFLAQYQSNESSGVLPEMDAPLLKQEKRNSFVGNAKTVPEFPQKQTLNKKNDSTIMIQ